MSTKRVLAKSVISASIHQRLPLWRRWYALPFIGGIYPALVYYYATSPEDGWMREYSWFAFGGVLALNVLLVLVCQWSLAIKVLLTCIPINQPVNGSLVYIVSSKHNTRRSLCPVVVRCILIIAKNLPIQFFNL